MNYDILALKERVGQIVGDGDISLLFNEIRKNLAIKIMDTKFDQQDLRESLYHQSNGLKLLEEKFQEYLNDINRDMEK